MKALTKEERRVVARRLFEALRVHYPNRYITLIERPVSTKLMIVGGTRHGHSEHNDNCCL
jgi:hypothetical protein